MYYEQKYGCRNCGRFYNPCRGDTRDCRLVICMAEHIAEPGKIEKFLDMLNHFKMAIKVTANGFHVVMA